MNYEGNDQCGIASSFTWISIEDHHSGSLPTSKYHEFPQLFWATSIKDLLAFLQTYHQEKMNQYGQIDSKMFWLSLIIAWNKYVTFRGEKNIKLHQN